MNEGGIIPYPEGYWVGWSIDEDVGCAMLVRLEDGVLHVEDDHRWRTTWNTVRPSDCWGDLRGFLWRNDLDVPARFL